MLLSLFHIPCFLCVFKKICNCGISYIRKRRCHDIGARENVPKCMKYETCQLTNLTGSIMVSNYEQNTHTLLFWLFVLSFNFGSHWQFPSLRRSLMSLYISYRLFHKKLLWGFLCYARLHTIKCNFRRIRRWKLMNFWIWKLYNEFKSNFFNKPMSVWLI